MARARGEHRPYVAYTEPGHGRCMGCGAPVSERTAVILPAPQSGSFRALLCGGCTRRALRGRRALDPRVALSTVGLRGKLCAHCGRVCPRTAQYWHRNRQTRDGLHTWCKECKSLDDRRRRRRQRRAA